MTHIVIMNTGKILPGRRYAMSMAVMLLLFSAHIATGQTWYRQSGGTVTQTARHYSSAVNDSPGVYVSNFGVYTLTASTITTTGNSTCTDSSSTNGLNAGIITKVESRSSFSNDTINTTGTGANGLYVIGAGSSVTIADSKITTSGIRAHGVDVTFTATATLNDMYISTTNDTASAVATDCGGGTINIDGGTLVANGYLSAGIYSTGTINVTNTTVTSTGDNGAVIDVNGIISMTNSALSGAENGFMVHNTVGMPYTATMSMNGGSITSVTGHAFFDTAATVDISISNNTTVSAGSGYLLYAMSHATAQLTAISETITGSIYGDATSNVTTLLQNTTTLTGAITNSSVSIDGSSTWKLSGTSHIDVLTDDMGVNTTALTVSNIDGNGYSVYYMPSLAGNSWLGGKTYALTNGGCLLPVGAVCSNTGVERIANAQTSITIYPNPATDELNISYPYADAGAVARIMSMDGRVLSSVILSSVGTSKMDVHELPAGVYIVAIANGNGRQMMRFVKQ